MNRKEIREIKKRIQPELENFGHIYGCYVNAAKEVVAEMDMQVIQMNQEEKEMYSGIFRKTLSGSLGKNLMNLEFATSQVGASDEHQLLQGLRMSHLGDENLRKVMYRQIIDSLVVDETSYVILMLADTYDVPYKQGNDEEWDEDSTDQFDYFICAICPVKDSKAALRYMAEDHFFRGASTGSVLGNPQAGFMFPCFDDRTTNVYSVLYYSRSSSEIHEELIQGLFNLEHTPIAPEKQRNAFGGALSEALEEECSLPVVQAVHASLRQRIEEHKESHDPNAPVILIDEVKEILKDSGVSDERIENFSETCRRYFDDEEALNPSNIIESRKFKVHTPETDITVDPEQIYSIRTQVIDGREYLLIPMCEGVTVNGVDIRTEEETVISE
ncbi:MAG: DUF4317 domain-containing protein [Eubacteriales bacterium]|nr:DUF4317 domain-containing protein [Eubacteriales bacterium]